jgi:hypothetical protein
MQPCARLSALVTKGTVHSGVLLVSAILLLAASTATSASDAGLDFESGKFGHVFYDDEPKNLTISMTGRAESFRGTIEVDVRSPYGDIVTSEASPISFVSGQTVRDAITLQTSLRGVFRVSARLRGDDGDVVVERTTTVGVVARPLTPGIDDASAVGYYFSPTRDDLARSHQIAQQFEDLGVKWVRLNYSWSDDRPERPDTSSPGWLDTAEYEAWVDVLRAHGIQVMAQITGLARWASSRPDATSPSEDTGRPLYELVMPRDADWHLFVRTFVARMRGRVTHFELLNEPDGHVFWLGTPDEYAALVRMTSAAMKAVNPAARLVVNFANAIEDDFPDALLSQSPGDVDIYGFHYQDGEWAATVKADLEQRGLAKPFWNTESYGDTTLYDGADRMFSHWLRQRAAGAERSFHFVYNMHWNDSSPDFIARFGCYPVNVDYTLREHGAALRTLSDRIGRAPFLFQFDLDRRGEMTGFAFGGATSPVVALLRGNTPAWDASPRRDAIIRLPLGYRSVQVVDLMGNEQTVRARHGRRVRIPLHGNPVFLSGIRSEDVAKMRLVGFVRRAR